MDDLGTTIVNFAIPLIANSFLLALATPAVLASAYLLFLTLLSAQNPSPTRSSRGMNFDLIVPAHNEQEWIGRTVRGLLQMDWPADRFKVIVIADNCTDETAEKARKAGALVIERSDGNNRGKGYALNFAFSKSRERGFAHAVIVIDADTEATPNLIEACASRLEKGAEAVQVRYGVLNPGVAWRTRLMTIAYSAFHDVRSRARERMHLSCGLRGNGMCFSKALIERVPFAAFSITEDLEYGIQLGMNGYRVHYADEAAVNAELLASGKDSESQRARWEGGRFAVVRSMTLPLLRHAWSHRSVVSLDLAIDLLVLPLSYLTLNSAIFGLIGGTAVASHLAGSPWPYLALFCLAAELAYVMRGWQLSGTGLRGLLDLAQAPFLIAWKLWVLISHRKIDVWIKTGRGKV